jgi:hypothetical protein
MLVPGTGIAHSFKVLLSAAPANAGSFTFTLRLNSADTALTVTITDPATSAQITTAGVVHAAGDTWSVKCVPSVAPAPTAIPTAQWELIVEDTSDISKAWITGGHQNTTSPSVIEFNSPAGGDLWALNVAGANNYAIPCPLSGNIVFFAVLLNGIPGVGTSYVITLRQGATALESVTIAGLNSSGNDSTVSAVTAGQSLAIRCAPSGTPTALRAAWAWVFIPEEPYNYPVMSGSRDLLNNGEFNSLFSFGKLWTATEASVQTTVKMGFFHKLYVSLGAAPGAGTSWTFTLFVNGSATSLALTISGATDLSGSNLTSSVEVKDDDLVSIKATASGAAMVTDAAWSVAYFTYSPHMYSAREGNMGN